MFSYKDRIRAVRLYLKYSSITKVISELGYPSVGALKQWVTEYKETNALRKTRHPRAKKYTEAQIRAAINYYLSHGKNQAKTRRDLGYPNKAYLSKWVEERVLSKSNYKKRKPNIIHIKKKNTIFEVKSDKRKLSSTILDKKGNNTKIILSGAKQQMPKNIDDTSLNKSDSDKAVSELKKEIELLKQESEILKKEVNDLRYEKDVLETVAEIIKKEPGINLTELTNKEKTIAIDTLRNKYKLKRLLTTFEIAKSSYCYQANVLNHADKYKYIRELIKRSFSNSNFVYGYRRIYFDLKEWGYIVSEKVIRRLMKQEHLMVKLTKQRKYCSYMGEISPAADNLIRRDFHSEKPNEKWLMNIRI